MLLSRPVQYATQVNSSSMSTSFYLYLSCLSDRYKGGFVQVYSEVKDDSSKSLVINIFKSPDADESSRLAFLEFGMSTFGFYPIGADDFYLSLDLASRQAQLLAGINEACVNKWLYKYIGEYELLKQHPTLH